VKPIKWDKDLTNWENSIGTGISIDGPWSCQSGSANDTCITAISFESDTCKVVDVVHVNCSSK